MQIEKKIIAKYCITKVLKKYPTVTNNFVKTHKTDSSNVRTKKHIENESKMVK